MKKISSILALICLILQSACVLKPLEISASYLKDKSHQCNSIVDIYIPKTTPHDKIAAIANSEHCSFTLSYCDDCHTKYISRKEYNSWAKSYTKLGLIPPHPKKTSEYNIFPPRHKRDKDYTPLDLGLVKEVKMKSSNLNSSDIQTNEQNLNKNNVIRGNKYQNYYQTPQQYYRQNSYHYPYNNGRYKYYNPRDNVNNYQQQSSINNRYYKGRQVYYR